MLQGTGKVCSLSTGFTISRLFSIYFTIIGGKAVIFCTEVNYIGVHCDKIPLYFDQGVDFSRSNKYYENQSKLNFLTLHN